MQPVQLAIARRAFELFEKRNLEHGHDWEDWFQAESELLRPVSITTLESVDRLSLRANVFGFGEDELFVSIEPKRVIILGKKEVTATETEGGKIEHIDWDPDQNFASHLPSDGGGSRWSGGRTADRATEV